MNPSQVAPGVADQPLQPRWPADWLTPSMGAQVGAVMTARSLVSTWSHGQGAYAGFNLGQHVGDDPQVVQQHRQAVESAVGMPALWLNQVHGSRVVQASAELARKQQVIDADGSFATQPGVICTVMVADCLPVLLAAPDGRGVAALHAGWRGLAGAGDMAGQGILESGVHALCEASACAPSELMAWLGPCIGPDHFEVGADVLLGFGVDPSLGGPNFVPKAADAEAVPRWLANLPGLARARLAGLGVRQVSGGAWCTVGEPSRYFSFRRDRVTGRQAACIWLR